MADLVAALGLMLVLEGALYALFPHGMREMLARMQAMTAAHLRFAGLTLALTGFVILAFLKGF